MKNWIGIEKQQQQKETKLTNTVKILPIIRCSHIGINVF